MWRLRMARQREAKEKDKRCIKWLEEQLAALYGKLQVWQNWWQQQQQQQQRQRWHERGAGQEEAGSGLPLHVREQQQAQLPLQQLSHTVIDYSKWGHIGEEEEEEKEDDEEENDEEEESAYDSESAGDAEGLWSEYVLDEGYADLEEQFADEGCHLDDDSDDPEEMEQDYALDFWADGDDPGCALVGPLHGDEQAIHDDEQIDEENDQDEKEVGIAGADLDGVDQPIHDDAQIEDDNDVAVPAESRKPDVHGLWGTESEALDACPGGSRRRDTTELSSSSSSSAGRQRSLR